MSKQEPMMKKTLLTMTNAFGVLALLYVGYLVIQSIPEVRRYIRISTM